MAGYVRFNRALSWPGAILALSVLAMLSGCLEGAFATLAGATPLLARPRPPRGEDNETRRRIHDLVSREPGLNLSDIVSRLDIGWGTAAYHTQILLRQGRVKDLRFLNRVCFFPTTEADTDRQLQTILLRQPNYEEIVRIVSETPGASQREIAARSSHARQYVSRLVNKLEDAGLLRAEPGIAGRKYFLNAHAPAAGATRNGLDGDVAGAVDGRAPPDFAKTPSWRGFP